MSRIEVYAFENADGVPVTEWTTQSPREAAAYGAAHKCRVMARIFEYSDSELMEDFTPEAVVEDLGPQRFTEQEVRSEVEQVQSYYMNHSDSPVYDAWCELITAHFVENPSQYLQQGLQGFYEQPVDDIIETLRLNDRIQETADHDR